MLVVGLNKQAMHGDAKWRNHETAVACFPMRDSPLASQTRM